MPTYIELIKKYSNACGEYQAGHASEQAVDDALEAVMAELYVHYTESGASMEVSDFGAWAEDLITKYF